mgnify:CR=1 FL=1
MPRLMTRSTHLFVSALVRYTLSLRAMSFKRRDRTLLADDDAARLRATARSDLYALGVLLFQLRSGRLPHEASSMGALLQQVATQAPPPLSTVAAGVTPALALLVGRLLAKRPAERPADAEEVAAVLRALALPAAP